MTAPDEITDWGISTALELIRCKLEGEPLRGPLEAGTRTPADSYQVIACLAREGGQLLRPEGHRGGPIGGSSLIAHGIRQDGLTRSSVLAMHDVATAARLLGYGAAGDAPMVRALALAVVEADDAPTTARSVARAMLALMAVEPIVRTDPQGDPECPPTT